MSAFLDIANILWYDAYMNKTDVTLIISLGVINLVMALGLAVILS